MKLKLLALYLIIQAISGFRIFDSKCKFIGIDIILNKFVIGRNHN